MTMCSFRRAALAACAVLACTGLAAPSAMGSSHREALALTATFSATDGQPVAGMVHMWSSGVSHTALRALIGGLPPNAPVAIIVNKVGGTDDLWAGTADPDGVVAVGIERPLPAFSQDLDSAGSLGVVYDDGDTGTHEVVAPADALQTVHPGTRPEVLLAALHGTSGNGQHFAAMLHYDNGDPDGPGVMSYIAKVSECEPASYRLSIVGPSGIRNFLDYTEDSCMHVASGREILVDDTTWGFVAHPNTDVVLSRIVDGAAMPLASSRGVKVGKLLGVNY